MKISLVINTYNRMHTLPNTLSGLCYLRYPELEVIVVDGPSTDGTSDYLQREWAGKVRIAHCPEANLSMSRNIGIDHASGEVVAFIDDDGIPEPDWLDELARAYRDPRVGAVGGFVRDHTGVSFQTRHIVSARDGRSEVLLDDPAAVPAATPGAFKVPGMIGVNSSFRRRVLHEVGGFDQEYAYYLDETDVIFRVVDAGYQVLMQPTAEVHHKYAPSHIRNEKGVARSWTIIARSTAYFCLQNAAPGQPLDESLYTVERHRRELRDHTRWARETNLIDQQDAERLYQEIDHGMDAGIHDAFAHPWRQLVNFNPDRPWLPFPRPRAADQRLRLALTSGLYPPRNCGGVGVIIHQMATELARQGHEVTVITCAEPGRPHTVDFEDGVWVHRLPAASSHAVQVAELPPLPPSVGQHATAVLAELERVSARRRFDCVLGTLWDLDTAAVLASRRFPVVLYLVTSYQLMLDSKPEWTPGSAYYEQHVRPMIAAERWALQQADLILTSTDAIRRDMEQAYALRLDDSRVARRPFGLPGPSASPAGPRPGSVQLLYVGRFETRKGIDTLVAALPQLLEANPELQVTLAGDNSLPGPDGRSWLQYLQEHYGQASWWPRLQLPGLLDDAELHQAYADCDIFVAPSRYESFGLIYLEAMRYAKACIGCDAGGVAEIVRHRETGLLVPPADSAALAEAIQQLVDAPSLREQYGQAGLQRFQQQFTLAEFVLDLEQLLRNISSTECHGMARSR